MRNSERLGRLVNVIPRCRIGLPFALFLDYPAHIFPPQTFERDVLVRRGIYKLAWPTLHGIITDNDAIEQLWSVVSLLLDFEMEGKG